jgi:hypothetical protein
MGLIKGWKELKALAASGMPSAPPAATQPGRRLGPAGGRPQHASMLAGFAGVMAQMMGPLLALYGPERGKPLPGTDPGALAPSADQGALAAGADAVRARDAAFDPGGLEVFAGQVFAAVSSAWASNDASGIRSVLADGTWDPIAAAMSTGVGGAITPVLATMRAQPVLVGLHAGDCYDSALFDVLVHLDLAQMAPEMSTWPEQWLFQRSVQPGGDPMALPDACPNCGAPTSADTAGRCTHCHQMVPVLTTGWLLTYVRSHNPMVETEYPKLIAEMQSDPSRLAMMPDEIVRLLPADVLIAADPARAARLGVTAT